jgi:hypothetical protein
MAAVVLAALAGCSSSDGDLEGPAGPLTGVCPDPLVVQADWLPLVEQGPLYALLDRGNRQVDDDEGVVRARLVADGVDQGIVLEIRSGGRATEHTDVPRLLHEDPELFAGLVATDQQLRMARRHPTVGVLTMLEKDPLAIVWDPATYDVEHIADLPGSAEVAVFGPGLFVDHLVDAGVLSEEQITFTHTGRPERFVEAGGVLVQQGFAGDVYLYEHVVDDWGRPLRYELIHDTGWQPYAEVLAVTPEVLEEHEACLELLVPILQRSVVAFQNAPDDTLGLVRTLQGRYDKGATYDADHARWIVDHYLARGIMGPSADGIVGGFDLDRLDAFLAEASWLLGRNEEFRADDLVTNRFLDPAIGGATRGGRARPGPGG